MNAPFKARPTHTIRADACVGISELKKNPSAVIAVAQEEQVAILNRNKPVAYLVAPHVWAHLLDVLDDAKLAEEAQEAIDAIAAGEETIPVSLDDL